MTSGKYNILWPSLSLNYCKPHTVVQVPGSSQHHQLVGVGGATLVGEVEVSALVGGCLRFRNSKLQAVEKLLAYL